MTPSIIFNHKYITSGVGGDGVHRPRVGDGGPRRGGGGGGTGETFLCHNFLHTFFKKCFFLDHNSATTTTTLSNNNEITSNINFKRFNNNVITYKL